MKILSINQAIKKMKILKQQGKKVVLVGGCFDILHYGHVVFLEKAKAAVKEAILVVLLESDEKVKRLKNEGRPIISHKERAAMLAALSVVDFVVLLPTFTKDDEYIQLTRKLSPDIIAVTSSDPIIDKKRQQIESLGGKLKVVTPRLKSYSSSKLVTLLGLNP